MKKGLLILSCFILVFNLSSCKNMYNMERMPPYQYNTFWESENDNISFYVHSFARSIGKMNVGDETVEVMFWWEMDGSLTIYSLDFLNDTDEPRNHEKEYYILEKWFCFFIDKDTFIAIVKETTHFEKGETILFKKADVDDAEIVFPPDENTGDESQGTIPYPDPESTE